MGKYFFDDRLVLDSGDYPCGTAADSASLYIDAWAAPMKTRLSR